MYELLNKVVDYLKLRLAPERLLIRSGLTLLMLALGMSTPSIYAGVVAHFSGGQFELQLFPSDPFFAGFQNFLAVLGSVLLICGVYITAQRFLDQRSRERRRINVIIEIRGLHSTPDTPAKVADLGLPIGRVHSVLIDFRPQLEGTPIDPYLVLRRLTSMKESLLNITRGVDSEDISIAVGGIAAVPAMFLVGMLIDDESRVVVYDWQRSTSRWRILDDEDDGVAIETVGFDRQESLLNKEVVLAVSASYGVDAEAIESTFPDIQVINLRSTKIRNDSFWSEEKVRRHVRGFNDAVQELQLLGVSKIHLVLAAPNSLCLRLGMSYDRRLMPELVVYQYERKTENPYPWGINMPVGPVSEPLIVET